MRKKIDLHMHSCCSTDGEFKPVELMKEAAKAGVELVSVTDHNTVRGIQEARIAAKENGIFFVSGIELDCIHDGQNLHILGYGIDENAPCFRELEEEVLSQERYAGGLRIELIRQCGIVVDGAWVCDNAINGVITGELIAESALHCKENKNNPLLEPYRHGGSRQDNPYLNFYLDYCTAGKPAFIPIHYRSAEKIINMIHENRGIAILAHPGVSIGKDETVIQELNEMGLDGIEVFSSYHDEQTKEFYKELAEKYRLQMTCGSDFHGKTKPSIALASVQYDEDLTLVEDFVLNLLNVL